MMNKATDDTSPAPGSGSQSLSQPSHLCQSCLSVLTRDDLECEKHYPHHSSLDAFIQATLGGCYYCSHHFASLDINDQENLMLLATGKAPDEKIIKWKKVPHGIDITEFTEKYSDPVERAAHIPDRHGMRSNVSFVSFTTMRLTLFEDRFWYLHVRLNPMYDAYIPPHLGAYRSSLKELWKNVAYARVNPPWIIPQQEYRENGLPEDLPSNTGSKETWTTIDGWLQECSDHHQCLANIDKNWYPTRLVEALPNNTWRVIRSDSKSFKPTKGYLTLSHRWGNGDFARLTTESLSAFEKGQPMTVLRKIFQEALAAAQRLNIPYVWIDSLCIIQDGDGGADWRHESILMAEVYSNSRCNISADWGDDYNGLFFERDPPFQKPITTKLRLTSPINDNDVLSKPRTPPDDVSVCIFHPESLMEDIMDAPLNLRGWVVQERMLAPRVLHFSPGQVSWECTEKLSSERAPLNFISESRTRVLAQLDFNNRHRDRMERLKLHELQNVVHWPRVVAYYSSCGLTKVQDKLVAIAGIAKRLRPVVKDRYVAGLWEKSLPTSLLWHRSGNIQGCGPPTQYYAPTFSWAASDGEMKMVDEGDFPDSRIIASAVFIKHRMQSLPLSPKKEARANPTTEILSDDVFGPLVSPEAEVRMRGILRSCSRVPPLPDPHLQPFCTSVCPSTDLKDPGVQVRLENGTVLDVTDDRATREGDPRPDSIIYYFTVIEASIVFPAPAELSGQNSYNHATGLLLRSVDAHMGRFERVSRVEYFRARGAADILQPLGNERDLPAWSYDKTTGEHTWYIV